MDWIWHGLTLGLLGLIPGLHVGMILLLGFTGLDTNLGNLLGIALTIGVFKSMGTITLVYYPVIGSSLASVDPAQRLASRGQDKWASYLLRSGLITGCLWACGLVSLGWLMYSWLGNLNILKVWLGGQILDLIVWLVILVWILIVSNTSKFSLVILLASMLLGCLILDNSLVRGSNNSLIGLLAGLFGVPGLVKTLLGSKLRQNLVLKQEAQEDLDQIKPVGLFLGWVSVGIPGIGTSSLVSLWADWLKTDTQYLKLASISEAFGEILALLLGLLAISQRSFEASVITKILGEINLSSGAVYGFCLSLLTGVVTGCILATVIRPVYKILVTKLINPRIQALVVLIIVIITIWSSASYYGLGAMLAGTMLSFGAKSLKVGNQALFGVFLGPMVITTLGINLS